MVKIRELHACLRRRPLVTYLAAFLLLTLPAAGLYIAAALGWVGAAWFLIGLVVLGQILVLALG